MTSPRRIGLLGGTFDPIHFGHLDAGAAAQRALQLTEILVLPSNIPPHRPQPIASSHHRFAMVAMAAGGRRGWRAADLELREAKPSYSSETLRRFPAGGVNPSELVFIIGADAFLEIATWHDYPAVLDLAHFAIVARSGVALSELAERLPTLAARMVRLETASLPTAADSRFAAHAPGGVIFLIDAVTADVSATAIRRARQAHQSITGQVPPLVQQHIEQHGLYQDPTLTAGPVQGSPAVAAGRLHGQD
jgi:nicotinate-nucleotide adenylyltransferase